MPELRNVDFSYGEKSILKNFSFSVNEGETTAVLGPSGFGKTTLLELFAEFLKPNTCCNIRDNFRKKRRRQKENVGKFLQIPQQG